jgi:hypothetical protein
MFIRPLKALLQCHRVQRKDFLLNRQTIKGETSMIRIMLFVASAITMVALITIGLTFGLPAKSTTSAAATPAAVQGCNFPITITKVDLGPRKTGGGHNVDVSWQAPSLPNCIAVAEYKVFAKYTLPNAVRDKEITVPGNQTSATVNIAGFVTDKDPTSVFAKVTAVLKTTATASGSKSQAVSTTP